MRLILGLLGVSCFFFSADLARAEWKGSANVDFTAAGLLWPNGKLDPDTKTARDIFTLKIPASLKNGRAVRFRFLPVLQADPENPSRVDPQHPDRNERYYWDIQEGYLQLQFLPWTFQIGQNVQTWGDTDVFNPIDVVNARRYYDPFLSEKLGSPTVLIKREWETVIAEALYIPWQPETLLPGEQSRWLPRDIYHSRAFDGQSDGLGHTFSGTVNVPANLSYHFGRKAVLSAATRDNFGARLKFRLPGFDWTLAGFQGAAVSPAVNITDLPGASITLNPGSSKADITLGPNVYLQALYYKTRMLGTSFVLVAGDFLVKGASAQNHVVSKLDGVIANRLPKDDWSNALGLERTFTVGAGSLTALLQGTYVKRDENLDSGSVSLARMFDQAAMVGLRWAPNEKWTVLASALYDIKYKGNLQHAEAAYKFADGFTGKLSGDLLDGETQTPLGTYRRNDRVMLSLNVVK